MNSKWLFTLSKISKQSKLIVGAIFITLFAVSAMTLWRTSRVTFDEMAHDDITKLQTIFEKIHRDCYIVEFEHVYNHIDFLNVKNFSGEKIGSMELAFPKKWRGPYLNHNLRVQNKLYAVLKNKQGYFIIPGDGVRLANGKVIGKSLILDQNSNMEKLMQDKSALKSKSGVLAAQIKIGSKAMKNITSEKLEILSAIDA